MRLRSFSVILLLNGGRPELPRNEPVLIVEGLSGSALTDRPWRGLPTSSMSEPLIDGDWIGLQLGEQLYSNGVDSSLCSDDGILIFADARWISSSEGVEVIILSTGSSVYSTLTILSGLLLCSLPASTNENSGFS